jgi:hypothetical protein
MLQQICEYLNNYFVKSNSEGTFNITDGGIAVSGLLEGQRFQIIGSVLNDGIYTWHEAGIRNDDDTAGAGLSDETFVGAVCGLAVPPQLLRLSAEINEWVGKYGDVINSPYQSESFGGYSYTRASAGGNSTGGSGAAGWQDVFKSRLKQWKKVAVL